jgi:hypothetical protein
MKLKLYRKFLGNKYTIGKLFINDEYICDTLEDVVRSEGAKVYGETAIPYGTYEIVLTMSPRFKKVLPLLLNVPNFEGVRIHTGNTERDTEGCILVGYNKVKGKVINSKIAFDKVIEQLELATINNEKITIEVC